MPQEDINGEIKLTNDLILKNVEINDKSMSGKSQQIIFTCDVKASVQLFKKMDHANTLIAYVSCSGDHARTYVAGQVFEKTALIPYNFSNEPILYNKEERQLHFIIPYRSLELPKGAHTLNFKIEFFEANFKIDPKQKNEGCFLSKENTPYAIWETHQRFNTPDLQKVALTVNHVALNTSKKDPKTYDVRFAGPGYPDLYWEIVCGGESIFKSPVSHNAIKINTPYTTPFFLCSPDDEIEIGIYDQDNTSKPDEVEIIRKKITNIGGKIKQGNLENIYVDIVKE